MGLMSFIKRRDQKKRKKRFDSAINSIGNNFFLLSENKINLAECVTTVGYFVNELIEAKTDLECSKDQIASISISYFMLLFREEMQNDKNSEIINTMFTPICIWVIDFVKKNNPNLTTDKYDNDFKIYTISNFDVLKRKRVNKDLLTAVTNTVFDKFDDVYGYDISEIKPTIKGIFQSVTDKFIKALKDWDSTDIRDMYHNGKLRKYSEFYHKL